MADNMPLVARIMVEHGGGGPPTGPGIASANGGGDDEGGSPANDTKNIKNIAKNIAKGAKTAGSNLAKTIGINVGISSLLKQSQIFTGYIGTIFQLMGALVDVILAPFLPIMIPAIKLLASFIPIAQELMKSTFKYLKIGFNAVVKWVKDASRKYLSWLPKLPSGFGKVMKKILVAVLIGLFFAKMFGVINLFKTSSIVVAKMSYAMLQGIYTNTLMMGGGMGKGAVKSGRFFGRAIKFFGRSLMRFAGIGVLLGGMMGLLGRGFSTLTGAIGSGFSIVKNGLGMNAAATRMVPREVIPANAANAGIISRAINLVKTAGIATGRFIWSGAVGGFNIVKGALGTAGNFIADKARAGFSIVRTGLIDAKNYIATKFPIIGRAVDRVKDGLNTAKTFIGDKVVAMKQAVGTAVGKVKDGVNIAKTFIGDRVSDMKKAVSDKVALGKQWALDMGESITKRLGIVKDAITGGLTTAWGKITSGLSTLGETLGGFFKGVGNLLKKIPGVSKAIDIAKDVGSAVKNGFSMAKGFLFGGGGAKVGGEAAEKSGGLFGKVAAGLGKIVPGLVRVAPAMARVARFIPGTNVLFEAGYGIYKTIDDYNKYGAKAAMARAVLTVGTTAAAFGATLLTGVGGVGATVGTAGLSIGGHYVLDKELKKRYGNGGAGGNGALNLKIIQETGVGTIAEQYEVKVQADGNNEITVRTRDPDPYGRGR